jgi:hypothetical protein
MSTGSLRLEISENSAVPEALAAAGSTLPGPDPPAGKSGPWSDEVEGVGAVSTCLRRLIRILKLAMKPANAHFQVPGR